MAEQTNTNTNQSVQPKKGKLKWGCFGIIIFIVFLFTAKLFFDAVWFWAPGGLPGIVNWIFTRNDKQPSLEEIVKMTEPAPERNYIFKNPPAEVKSRTIDCQKLSVLEGELKPKNPLCLNLYRTSAEEIDKKIRTGEYDRIILYGQYLIFDTPSIWERDIVPGVEDKTDKNADPRDQLAERAYRTARFNDQITMPAMLGAYGLKDLALVNSVLGKKVMPYPAIYSRVSSYQDRKILCVGEASGDDGPPIGCAHQFWSNVVDPNAMRNPISLPNQRVHRVGREDFMYYDLKWPANCYAQKTFLHETAHNLYNLAMYSGNHMGALSDVLYFDEHQAGLFGDMGGEVACGEGTVSNYRSNKNVSLKSIMDYNSIYPAAELSSQHPAPGEKCKLAALTAWNRYLNSGDWTESYSRFFTAVRDRSNQKYAFQNGAGFISFLANLSGDPETRNFLNSNGCGL